jgi:integrase
MKLSRAAVDAVIENYLHGHPLDGVAVTERFQELLNAAKLPRMRLHDLRHSSASRLLA